MPAALAVLMACALLADRVAAADNLLLVTVDGLRWQEVFGGIDRALCDEPSGGVRDCAPLLERFDGASRDQRRRRLLPFLWSIVDRGGVLLGDVESGSSLVATNGRYFSYPGYGELLSGFASDAITSNAKRHNPNATVLEWLQTQDGFAGRVAAVASWDVFPYILNRERSELPVNAGWQPVDETLLGALDASAQTLNYLMARTTPEWEGVRFDAFTAGVARELVRRKQPRVLYVALGEPDDWAHGRHYDRYLGGAALDDRLVGELWAQLQELPQYRARTALLVTTDHGRGWTGADWTSHGEEVPGAEHVWALLFSPDAVELPSASTSGTLAQIAATAAALLGADYRAAEPRAAPPLVPSH